MTVVDHRPGVTRFPGLVFQSLLLWMTVVDLLAITALVMPTLVSILVVVDDGRRHEVDTAIDRLCYTFQSLLLWMTVVDKHAFSIRITRRRVSILVVVDDGRRHARRDRTAAGGVTSFNPCCCG